MKTEAILTRVNEIIASVEHGTPGRTMLEALAVELAEQVRAEYANAHGVGSVARAVNAVLKACKRHSERTALHYAWIDDKGRQCICDGYQAYRLRMPLPLEERPKDAGEPIDLGKVMPENAAGMDELPLPSLAELKAHIALERSAKGSKAAPLWDFGAGRPCVDARMLASLAQILPDTRSIYAHRGSAGIAGTLYATAPSGDAVIMPTRTEDYADRCKAADDRAAAEDAAADAERADEKRIRTLTGLLDCIRSETDHDPKFALEPDGFAEIARYAYQPA